MTVFSTAYIATQLCKEHKSISVSLQHLENMSLMYHIRTVGMEQF